MNTRFKEQEDIYMDNNTGLVEQDPKTQEAVDTLQQQYLVAMTDNISQAAQVKTAATAIDIGTGQQNVNYVIPQRQLDAEALLAKGTSTDTPDVVITGDKSKLSVQRKTGESFDVVPTQPQEPVRTFDLRQSVLASTNPAQSTFNFDAKIQELKAMPYGTDRQAQTAAILSSIEEQAVAQQGRLRAIAAQKAGVNDAQDALTLTMAIQNKSIAQGIMRPGDVSYQLIEAQKVLVGAQLIANKQEEDFIKSDPTLARLASYRTTLNTDFKITESRMLRADNEENKALAKEMTRQQKLAPGATDPAILANFVLATKSKLDMSQEVDRKALEDQFTMAYNKNDPTAKALQKTARLDRDNAPILLTDPDPIVRKQAYDIVVARDRISLGLSDTDPMPGYLKTLGELVKDPNVLLTPEDKKKLTAGISKQVDAKGKAETTRAAQANSINNLVNEIGRAHV